MSTNVSWSGHGISSAIYIYDFICIHHEIYEYIYAYIILYEHKVQNIHIIIFSIYIYKHLFIYLFIYLFRFLVTQSMIRILSLSIGIHLSFSDGIRSSFSHRCDESSPWCACVICDSGKKTQRWFTLLRTFEGNVIIGIVGFSWRYNGVMVSGGFLFGLLDNQEFPSRWPNMLTLRWGRGLGDS
jgi:hypothetical protein